MGPFGSFLFLIGAVVGGMFLKNYVHRFAGWNLFALSALTLVAEIALLMAATFIWALSK